ncbi:MAG: hypothetical protein IK118_06495 [Clostridia bacterium]|nr:hypothetical protein [Clostridia bacterium]
MRMRNDDRLIEALRAPSMKFTVRELRELLDDELNKAPEEMDTELVDLCAGLLRREIAGAERGRPKMKRRKTAKNIALIAAILFVLFGISIPVYARYVHNNTSDRIVKFVDDHFRFDLRNGLQNYDGTVGSMADCAAVLAEKGIDGAVLPKELISDRYPLRKVEDEYEDLYRTVRIVFGGDRSAMNGYIHMMFFEDANMQKRFQQAQVGKGYQYAEQLTINGMDVLVFGSDTDSILNYANGNANYFICLENCDFDAGLSFARSIGE